MMCRLFLLFCGLSMAVAMRAQSYETSVMFWNVENLFDCKDDTLKDDADFLPGGKNRWSASRYWRKLDNLSRVFAHVANGCKRWPALIGLAEVENDSVLRDLTRRSPLSIARYRYVLTSGLDSRGIDVGLLYQPSDFNLLHWHAVRVPSVKNGFPPTRDILYVNGVMNEDTLHVLVAHLPSKSRGGRASRRHRRLVMECLREIVDSLAGEKVLLMGDFNAEPNDALFKVLSPPMHCLTEHVGRGYKEPYGTYVFQGVWNCLDHMLVSPEFLPLVEERKADVVEYDFMLNEKGHPWRTYRGPVYEGGFSDHLPIILRINSDE